MSPLRNALLLGMTLIASAARGALDNSEPGRGYTRVPPIYLMHYVRDAPRHREFMDQIRVAPPDILHLGHAVPLNSIFGPTADYTGFNPKLVPVAELVGRKEELRKFVALLHQAGVKKVIPYVNPSILGGDHLTRRGFFDFYDHWDDYAALGLGPKPARWPELWMQRDRRSFAPWEPEPNYPLWRYEPCPNEPAWRQYQSAVIRLIAESGFDGVFVDDCIMECHHDLCAERFAGFLRKHYSARDLRRLFGSDPGFGESESAGAHTRLRQAETYRFWQQSVADLLAEFNRVGRLVNPDFFTVPNWGASARVRGAGARLRSGKDAGVWRRAASCQLFEEDHPAGYAGPRDVISYLLQYNYGLAIGVRPVILSYGTTRRHVELGYAEAAAGGGGAYAESTAAYPDIRKKWRALFEENRELFTGFRLRAPVGLILSMDEPRYGNDEHLREAFAISRALYGLHIPFAAVPPENLTSTELARYKVLVAPHVQHLSDAQCAQLKSFVRRGGRLLVDTQCGVRDWLDLPRRPPFAGVYSTRVNSMPSFLTSKKGGLVQVDSLREIVPQREFALVDALDVRDNKAFVARVREIAATAPDPVADHRFRQWFVSLAGDEVALAEAARDVHTVAYERFSQYEGALIVHAIRYAAATSGEEPPIIRPAPLTLEVPLPSGWELHRASVHRPGEIRVTAAVHVTSNKVRCQLPSFEFYSLLELQLRRASERAIR